MKGGSIMQKTFYIIVPFAISEIQIFGEGTKMPKLPVLTEDMFQRSRGQLLQRVEFVILGLRACGLQAVPLNTLELAELFWGIYHPIEAERGYYPEIPPEMIK